ncbi:hypothetical protein ACX3O0_14060 [Homoserinimonas sp. A447]
MLHIDDCPNWQETGARLTAALKSLGRDDVEVSYQRIDDSDAADRTGFAGSPTIMVNGADLFPSDGRTSDLACRIYFTPQGLAGAPTQVQILDSLAAAL